MFSFKGRARLNLIHSQLTVSHCQRALCGPEPHAVVFPTFLFWLLYTYILIWRLLWMTAVLPRASYRSIWRGKKEQSNCSAPSYFWACWCCWGDGWVRRVSRRADRQSASGQKVTSEWTLSHTDGVDGNDADDDGGGGGVTRLDTVLQGL